MAGFVLFCFIFVRGDARWGGCCSALLGSTEVITALSSEVRLRGDVDLPLQFPMQGRRDELYHKSSEEPGSGTKVAPPV